MVTSWKKKSTADGVEWESWRLEYFRPGKLKRWCHTVARPTGFWPSLRTTQLGQNDDEMMVESFCLQVAVSGIFFLSSRNKGRKINDGELGCTLND